MSVSDGYKISFDVLVQLALDIGHVPEFAESQFQFLHRIIRDAVPQPHCVDMSAITDDIRAFWESEGLTNTATQKPAGISPEVAAENERLRAVAAEAYQVVGTLSALLPNGDDSLVSMLDNLNAAAVGKSIPHETVLPFLLPHELGK